MGWDKTELPQRRSMRALARLQAAMRAIGSTLASLHQSGAAERGVLAHRLHAVLDRKHAAGAARRHAGARHRAVQARRRLDPDDRLPRRNRQHAEARTADRAGARRSRLPSGWACSSSMRCRRGIYDDITAAAPDGRADRCRRDLRRRAPSPSTPPSAADRTRRRDCASRRSIRSMRAATDAGALAGLVEKHARLAAAEEAYIAIAADLDADRRLVRVSGPKPLGQRFAVRASIAYKGGWVRRTRSFARDADGAARCARPKPGSIGSRARSGRIARWHRNLGASSLGIPGARAARAGWRKARVGSYPLEVVAGSRVGQGRRFRPGHFWCCRSNWPSMACRGSAPRRASSRADGESLALITVAMRLFRPIRQGNCARNIDGWPVAPLVSAHTR